MKKIIISFFICYACMQAKSQSVLQDSVELNLLNAPANPAFNLMGISPSSVERPTDLNSFRVSIQNATNSFTKLPSNYAVEFSPASIFGRKSQTLQKFNSSKFSDVFWQSFSVSVAVATANKDDKETNDTSSFTKLGFGLKVSLVRPHWTATTVNKIDSFYYFLKLTNDEYIKLADPVFRSNEKLQAVEKKMADPNTAADQIPALVKMQGEIRQSIINGLKDSLQQSALAKASADLKAYSNGLKIERRGAFLDLASGIALDFPDNRFNYSMVSKAGAWLTGGYENGNKGFSILAIGRYLFQPDKIYADDSAKIKSADISTFDFGGRLLCTALKGKFNIGAEAVYRSVLNDNVIPASWRLVLNAEYDVGFNQKLTFSLGKNFDGTVNKSGNIIAALNFIRGFGSSKKTTN